jgi:hypothetical protein
MKAPVAVCCGTVARTHGSLTVTCAKAAEAEKHKRTDARIRFTEISFVLLAASPWRGLLSRRHTRDD